MNNTLKDLLVSAAVFFLSCSLIGLAIKLIIINGIINLQWQLIGSQSALVAGVSAFFAAIISVTVFYWLRRQYKR